MIDWERTKNDVRSTISLFCRDLVHTSKICGRRWLGGGDLRGWLGTNIGVPFGMGWSILIYGALLSGFPPFVGEPKVEGLAVETFGVVLARTLGFPLAWCGAF